MDWPSMEQELAAAKFEIQQLKGKLAKKDEAIFGLEMDMNFHVLKAQELEGILHNQENPDEIRRKLQVKSIQNAGLTVQVQELRRQLDDASHKRHMVETELRHAMEKIQRLGDERKSHQKMLFEMGDVVRMLGQIDIDYTIDNDEQQLSSWKGHERTLDNIKCKIRALEEDRQKHIQENQDLQTQLFEKLIELDSYQKEEELVEPLKEERDRLQRENEELQKAMTTRDEFIQALKHSLSSAINKEDTIPRNIVCEQYVIYKESEQSQIEAVLQNDGSTVVCPSSTGSSSHLSQDLAHPNSSTAIVFPADDMCSLSSLESPEIQSTADVVQSSDIQESEKVVVVVETSQIATLQKELDEARQQVTTIKTKQELREKMLRDVIFQYKELQKEHDAATARLALLEPPSPGSSTNCSAPTSPPLQNNTSTAPNQTECPQLKESPTFETTSSSVATTSTGPVPPSPTGTAINVGQDSSMDGPQQQVGMCRHEFSDEEYRQLEKEYSRLEHEYDDAVARIANLEEDLTKVKEDLTRAESRNQEKDQEFLQLQQQWDALDADHKTVVEKAAKLQEDLDYAQEQASQAKLKRDQREADLWDVIDQYKKLAEENEHTVAKMQGVENQLGETQALVATMEQQLALTKRQSKRNDLVYDNMRLKQEMEDCKVRMEEMERDLRAARSDAVRHKEDSRSLRNRLAGSNFQFKQLKEQYENLMTQKTNLERNLDKAQRELKILKTQSQAASSKAKQATNSKPNQYLRGEISELHSQHDKKIVHQPSASLPVL